ncbi:YHYH domain-containing protein [Halalkalibacter alkalisediminis]|uniref:YHYH domain-containing protein n=1 Tax=Halalkalibacter alkalisediminis TaxID=935616 RepID=A0ABV6NJH1_9BACI|nr:YHYH domain-containing protein [Halalkalibacter alkalisediminis]
MKKFLVIAGLLILTLFLSVQETFAHPGRTDSNGGHTCRTNCEKWGYKTGEYHKHNGGTKNTSSSTNTTAPKPSYTQVDVDKGKVAGEANGFDDGYSRAAKTTNTDSGNQGFKIGYAAGYEAGYNEGLKKIREEDRLDGSNLGKEEGKSTYRKKGENEVSYLDTKSEDWNDAYKEAFLKAFEREEKIHSSEIAGYDLGYSLGELIIPEHFSNDEELKKSFEKNFKKGLDKRTKEESEKNFNLGKENGYILNESTISSIDTRFEDSYKNGYEEGKLNRKEEVISEGYHSAFVNITFIEPTDSDHEEILEWYLDGYQSNDVAQQIKDTALENGRTNSKYFIPEQFEINADAIALYDELFEEGQEMRAAETKTKMMYAAGLGIPLGGVSLGVYFKKRRKKTND